MNYQSPSCRKWYGLNLSTVCWEEWQERVRGTVTLSHQMQTHSYNHNIHQVQTRSVRLWFACNMNLLALRHHQPKTPIRIWHFCHNSVLWMVYVVICSSGNVLFSHCHWTVSFKSVRFNWHLFYNFVAIITLAIFQSCVINFSSRYFLSSYVSLFFSWIDMWIFSTTPQATAE